MALSTVIPELLTNLTDRNGLKDVDGYLNSGYYNIINTPSIIGNRIINSNVILFTAHPDDESMFFTPTITELSKSNYNNLVHVVCLSNGGYDGLGEIRENELLRASKILNIESVKVLDYVDDINKYWNTKELLKTLDVETRLIENKYKNKETIIITFDKDGVSNHPNHKSISEAVSKYHKKTGVRVYFLKSWNILLKYSGMIATTYELLFKLLEDTVIGLTVSSFFKKYSINIKPNKRNVIIYTDLNSLFLNLSAMSWAHYSQIVWFRWIWIFSSKYMTENELVPLK